MKHDVRYLTCFLLSVVLIASGCGRRRQMPTIGPPSVTVAPAIKRQVLDFDEYTGHVDSIASVDVYAKVSGYLQEVAFQDGDMVKAGELLYLIDKRTYEAEYNQALSQVKLYEAKATLADATLARNKKLVGNGAVSQELYDESVAAANEAQAQIATAQAQVAATKVNLDYCTITAAITGHIDRTYVTKGNLIQSGVGTPTLLTTIVSVDPMYAYFDVDEIALLRYLEEHPTVSDTQGDNSLRERKIPVQLTLADGTIYPKLGIVDFGSNQVNPGTGTITVRAVVPNKLGSLRPGLFTRVKVASGKPYDAILVPETAIGADQSERYVYVMDEKGDAQRRNVELGTKHGKLQVVTSGVQEGDQVIVNGILQVRPGKPVLAEKTTMPEPPGIDPEFLRSAKSETMTNGEEKPPAETTPKPQPVDRPSGS